MAINCHPQRTRAESCYLFAIGVLTVISAVCCVTVYLLTLQTAQPSPANCNVWGALV